MTRAELETLLARELAQCTPEQVDLFRRLAIEPAKWQQSPWGERGGGFWVVAVMADRAIWYNDIEEGFNVSRFGTPGTIPVDEYWCNQDSLAFALRTLSTHNQGSSHQKQPEPVAATDRRTAVTRH